MLEAYERHPYAFTSSVQERATLPLAWWEARLSETGLPKEIVFGSFVDDELAGVAGLAIEQREKAKHKAILFGMYVRDKCRGTGLGGRLVDQAIGYARSRSGVLLIQLTVTEGNRSAQALCMSERALSNSVWSPSRWPLAPVSWPRCTCGVRSIEFIFRQYQSTSKARP
jgi:GNAT superfamily N-acetyltransferase